MGVYRAIIASNTRAVDDNVLDMTQKILEDSGSSPFIGVTLAFEIEVELHHIHFFRKRHKNYCSLRFSSR